MPIGDAFGDCLDNRLACKGVVVSDAEFDLILMVYTRRSEFSVLVEFEAE